MAQRPDVQYIRLYTNGSAALKLEPAVDPNYAPKSAPRKMKRKKIYVDPVAICSIILAVCMLVTVISGFVRLNEARAQVAVMEEYVDRLQKENAILSRRYEAGYDLEEIRQTALALDMIPKEQAACVTIEIPQEAEPVAQLTFWERVGTFLTGLFA